MPFNLQNLTFGVVDELFDASQTSLKLKPDHAERFDDSLPDRAVLWNHSDYNDPAEAYQAGEAEIIEITTVAAPNLSVIVRGQEGTTPIAAKRKKVYRVSVVATQESLGAGAPSYFRVSQPFQSVSAASSTTIDWASGNHVLLDMDTDITTLTLSNPRDGEHYFIRIIQDGTGSHSISWPSSIKWKSGSAPAAGEANQIDAVAMVYSSTYSDYLADVATNFS